MKFGIFNWAMWHETQSTSDVVRNVVDEVVLADELGFHGYWIGEHHFSTLGVLSCPDITLAYIAARTQRIRLAPAVTVLPLHHPIRVAEQWASLDLLSGGRVDFAGGAAAGGAVSGSSFIMEGCANWARCCCADPGPANVVARPTSNAASIQPRCILGCLPCPSYLP